MHRDPRCLRARALKRMDMFFRLLGRSLAKRPSRVAAAVVAVALGASIASGLLTVSLSVSERISEEFRQFGANIVVLPRSDTIMVGLPGISFGSVTEQRYINESDLWRVKKLPRWSANVLGFAPFLYQVVRVGPAARDVVLAGTYFDEEVPTVRMADGTVWRTGVKYIAPYWEIKGGSVSGPADARGALVGASVARKLDLSPGSEIDISYVHPFNGSSTNLTLEVRGIVSTGGTEDSQIFVNLATAQELTGRPDKVHSVQVSALCVDCPAEVIAAEIEDSLPGVEARSVKQFVMAEERIMMQLEQMMLLVSTAALVAAALGVMTTTTTTVIERRKEIALMKAVGADNSRIASLFLSEAALLGLIGGFLGWGAGLLIAQYIGSSVFDRSVEPVSSVLPITLAISLFVVLLASVLPVRRALQVEPAAVLKGE